MDNTRERKIHLYEVGLRDWRLCHNFFIPTALAVEIIKQEANAGVKRIEVGAFLNYEKFPHMRNSPEILKKVKELREQGEIPQDTIFSIYVGPGRKNYPKSELPDEISLSISASEERNLEIYHMSGNKIFEHIKRKIKKAREDNLKVRGYVSAAFGYRNHEDVPIGASIGWTELLFDLGCYEVSIGDTRGQAIDRGSNEKPFLDKWRIMRPHLNLEKIALHFHEHNYIDWEVDILEILQDISTFDTSILDVTEPHQGREHDIPPLTKEIPPNAATKKMIYFLNQISQPAYKSAITEAGLDEDTIFTIGIDYNKIVELGNFIKQEVRKLRTAQSF